MQRSVFFLLLLLVLVPFQAFGQQWELDPVHTNFYFEVRHTFAPVRGQFTEFSGDVFFDPADPAKSKFDFVIKVDSIDTKVGKRDTHLKSPDFFYARKFPEMVFRSSKVSMIHSVFDPLVGCTIQDPAFAGITDISVM